MKFMTATASRSASTSRGRIAALRAAARRIAARMIAALLAAASLPAAVVPAAAGPRLESFQGHLAIGYAKLLNPGSPGGSLAIGAGVDYPVHAGLRAGVDVGFLLLGSQVFERGSLAAELDHSVFEALALVHWTPSRGPIGLVSVGPGLFHARADLSSSGPAAFSDLAVEETAPGAAINLTAIARRSSPVKAGFEFGVRALWLPNETWTVAVGGLTVHY